jgi:glutamate/tyrosine decarboxylase-like PLP-dependent enzyme
MYMGHQVSAPLPAAVWAESLIAALNQSLAVFEMSPAATAIEHQLVHWMCDLAGFPAGAGGTLTSGGTEATFTALLAARSQAIPDVWQRGMHGEPPVVVCGEHAHYAVTRAAGAMGLGLASVVLVPSRAWQLDVAALSATLEGLRAAGRRVMAVVATSGSTATGSFDDLAAIAALCDERGIWLHVDGAHGASALLSAEHRKTRSASGTRGCGRSSARAAPTRSSSGWRSSATGPTGWGCSTTTCAPPRGRCTRPSPPARTSRRSTSRSATSSASATWATARWTTRRSTR